MGGGERAVPNPRSWDGGSGTTPPSSASTGTRSSTSSPTMRWTRRGSRCTRTPPGRSSSAGLRPRTATRTGSPTAGPRMPRWSVPIPRRSPDSLPWRWPTPAGAGTAPTATTGRWRGSPSRASVVSGIHPPEHRFHALSRQPTAVRRIPGRRVLNQFGAHGIGGAHLAPGGTRRHV